MQTRVYVKILDLLRPSVCICQGECLCPCLRDERLFAYINVSTCLDLCICEVECRNVFLGRILGVLVYFIG